VGNQAMADRYTYIPSLGIILAVVWFTADLARMWRWQKFAVPASAVALACICFGLTRRQIPVWRDSESLFQQAVKVTPDNTLALIGLGAALAGRGETSAAIGEYQKAIAISPNYFEAHNNLGLAFMERQQWPDAIQEFKHAIAARPGAVEAHINLAVALARNGDPDAAITELEGVVAANPGNALAHANLGSLYLGQQKIPEAIREFKIVIVAGRPDPQLHARLGGALLSRCRARYGRPDKRRHRGISKSPGIATRICRGPAKPGQGDE
jgi:tetratricopeptide (TPR) repeat protein